MLLGKVGNKSIAFINHKPFHPGNLQNLERVWLAEKRAAETEKKQKEMLERRKHEVQIEELRKALHEKERQQHDAFAGPALRRTGEKRMLGSISVESQERYNLLHGMEECEGGLITSTTKRARCVEALEGKTQKEGGRQQRRPRRQKGFETRSNGTFTITSRYKENVLQHGHAEVWGSYWDTKTQRWGYACCKVTEVSAKGDCLMRRNKQQLTDEKADC